MFYKKGVLRNFPKLFGEHLGWSVFLKNFQVWDLELYLKKTPAQIFYILEHLFCIWLPYVMQKRCSKKYQNSRQNSCEWVLLVLVRIGLVLPAANLLMFCRIDCKLVCKVFSLSTGMQSSTDLALMSTQSIY